MELKNISINDFQLVTSASGAYILLSLGSGQGGRIAAGAFTEQIKPSIKNGVWFIGSQSTGVTAQGEDGKSVRLRRGSTGIEWAYANEENWQMVVSYSELKLNFDDLTEEQKSQLKMTLDDLSEEDIALLQQPARDMIATLQATNVEMQAAKNDAQDTADHPTYIGIDYFVYKWNKTSKVYDKTDIYVKGEQGEQGVQGVQGVRGVQGEPGQKGEDGLPPTLQLGDVTTLEAGANARAKITLNGTTAEGSPIYKIDLFLPRGAKGENGSGAGNVLVDASQLEKGKQYVFTPNQNGSAEGRFEESHIPDEEDITSVGNKLKLKDRTSDDGMGRIILRKSKTFEEQLTQTNTVYEIRYEFDLNGDEVDMPEGCVLDFQGGSLNNGSVNGKNTIIKSQPVKIFNSNITLAGTWNAEEAYPEWFGAEGDGVTDDSDAFNRMFKDSLFPIYSFKNTTYILGNTVYIGGRAERYIKRVIKGNSAIFKPGRNLDVMFNVGLDDLESNETYPGVIDFNSFSVLNNGYSVETIFKIVGTFSNLRNISIQGDTDRQFFNTAIWLQRDWFGSVIEQCVLHFCKKAIVLAGQVNLLHIYKCAVLACDYGVYTDSSTSPVMVSHEADDLWIDNCDFEGNTHSIFHNDKLCSIRCWKITNNHFESNKGDEIYIPTKVDSSIFNLHGAIISSNSFLGFKGMTIGTEDGGEVFGVLLSNNEISGDEPKTILVKGSYTRSCLEYGNRCSSGIAIVVSDTFNSNDKPSGSAMVRYENQPNLPWGTWDTKGVNGDIRWNERGLFVRNKLWRFIPAYEFDSSSDIKISGTTGERPTGVNVGFQYFDTTLNKPIWWKGGQWVDATGNVV